MADLAARLTAAKEAQTTADILISDQKTAFWEEQCEKDAVREELDSLKAARGAVRRDGNNR